MAKLLYGIWGALSGKLGNLVGVTRKGVAYLRKYPKPSTKPQTAKQIAHRARFKFMHQFLLPFRTFFNVGFGDPNSVRTPLNAAFAANYKRIVKGSYPDFEVDYAAMVMSKGPLANLYLPKWEICGTDVLELSWTYPVQDFTDPDDQVMLVVFDPQLKKAQGIIGGVSRSSGSCRFNIHRLMVGHALELYVSVFKLDRTAVSDSMYLGRVVW